MIEPVEAWQLATGDTCIEADGTTFVVGVVCGSAVFDVDEKLRSVGGAVLVRATVSYQSAVMAVLKTFPESTLEVGSSGTDK